MIGSILFGFVIFGKEFYNNGNWDLSGLLWVAYGSIAFGFLFNLLFSVMIKKMEEDEREQE